MITKERPAYVEVFYRDELPETHDTMVATAIIGYDGETEDYDFDPMVWFYFEDEAEFERAKDPGNTEFEFYVREVEV